jgi:ribosomal-protein-alanine N-acetyltransferase
MSEIERRCFSDPWRLQDFQEVLASPGIVAAVAVWPEGLGGYLVARRVAAQAEILTLAVAPERHRRGVASALLGHVLDRFTDDGVSEIFLEVRRSNRAAQRLYRHFGFALVGVRRSYYRKPSEDALILARRPGGAASKGPISLHSD